VKNHRLSWVTSRSFYIVLNIAVVLCIFLIGLLAIDLTRHWVFPPSPQIVYSNPKTEVTDALETFKDRFDDQEKLLDKLAALTGIYTLILAGAAWAGLAQTRAKVEEEYQSLSAKIERVRGEIPSVYELNHRVLDLLQIIRRQLPDANVTLPGTDYAKSPRDRETVLLCERTIAALDVFDLRANTETRMRASEIYNGLARFYLLLWQRETPGENRERNRARMGLYLERVRGLEDSFQSAVSWRLEGMLHLLNYQQKQKRQNEAAETGEPRNEAVLRHLLEQMKACFWTSIDTDENEAGAWYNLASYAVGEFGKDPLLAIDLLNKLVKRRDRIQEFQRAMFLPDTCLNIACFHMRYLASANNPPTDLRRSHEAAALEACALGKQLAKEYGALPAFLEGLKREVDPGGDLVNLKLFHPQPMEKIAAP
jgi:hypothetical protein